jgi:uncharacterized protein
VFLAGFVGEGYGSVVGGGGIMIQAALLFVGLPLKSNLATGTAGGLGTEAGVISETYQQIIDNKRLAIIMAIPFTLGGIVGLWLLLEMPVVVIKGIMVVAVFLIMINTYSSRRQNGSKPLVTGKARTILLFVFMFLSGLYGKMGPGEGTFSKLALMSVLGFSFIKSQGLKSAATVPGRIIVLVVTGIAGLLVWPYVITLWVSTFIAAKYATRFAKRVPEKYLRAVLSIVSFVFVIYLLFFYDS